MEPYWNVQEGDAPKRPQFINLGEQVIRMLLVHLHPCKNIPAPPNFRAHPESWRRSGSKRVVASKSKNKPPLCNPRGVDEGVGGDGVRPLLLMQCLGLRVWAQGFLSFRRFQRVFSWLRIWSLQFRGFPGGGSQSFAVLPRPNTLETLGRRLDFSA